MALYNSLSTGVNGSSICCWVMALDNYLSTWVKGAGLWLLYLLLGPGPHNCLSTRVKGAGLWLIYLLLQVTALTTVYLPE